MHRGPSISVLQQKEHLVSHSVKSSAPNCKVRLHMCKNFMSLFSRLRKTLLLNYRPCIKPLLLIKCITKNYKEY